jgi:hypothetical protein
MIRQFVVHAILLAFLDAYFRFTEAVYPEVLTYMEGYREGLNKAGGRRVERSLF